MAAADVARSSGPLPSPLRICSGLPKHDDTLRRAMKSKAGAVDVQVDDVLAIRAGKDVCKTGIAPPQIGETWAYFVFTRFPKVV
jgi:hypothetical protein